MIGLLVYTVFLIFKAPKLVSFFAFFIFLTLLPALPLNYKVTSRNLYLPSIGFSIALAYLITLVVERFKSRATIRHLIIAGVGVYVLLSVAAIWVTSLEYRRNQTLVAAMISDIQASHTDLTDCKFVLLDHMPGRTVIGPTMIYKLGYKNVVVASNDPVNGPIDIPKVLWEIEKLKEPFVVFDYRDGHLVEVTREYLSIDEFDAGS